ncbi:2-phospho-L-lactate guanylyltransferase [Nesterenkonia sp. NBAIMH1]|uniref:2-phospho-L-lactate guanylyltransferase n=1 Tax=Nesterenkonia sp. NBAIMH1 TaxID=2600320 RepID=UPI001FEE332A|nr:2-phospho-L-lactate guanylyltransferase [Nesterenkonia sp. NBAIMH1]
MQIGRAADSDGFRLVVPVRRPSSGKTRLAAELGSPPLAGELAEAAARDTLEAVSRCPRVHSVLLVTDDAAWSAGLPCDVHVQARAGLNAAVRAGLTCLGETRRTAVMLGDLPALRPDDLGEALDRARSAPRGFVSDRYGTGTVLLTASAGARHRPRFGTGSALLHRTSGYTELTVPAASTLRHDVDTLADLRRAAELGLGPHTARVVEQGGLQVGRAEGMVA